MINLYLVSINKDHNGLSDIFCTAGIYLFIFYFIILIFYLGVRHLKFWSFIRESQQKDEQLSNQVTLTMKTGTMGKVSFIHFFSSIF